MRRYFLDTNVLLRMLLPTSPEYAVVSRAVAGLRKAGFELCCFSQSLRELWLVLRRDVDKNGYGLSNANAQTFIGQVLRTVTVLDEPAGAATEWLRLVTKYDVSGKTTHDTNIVACMSVLGERQLLTLNLADFQRYEEIEPRLPGTV
jgi:predicted nucleic acid-binding protein